MEIGADRISLYSSPLETRTGSHTLLYKAADSYLSGGKGNGGPKEQRRIPPGPSSAWRLGKGEHGKPYFPDAPDVHFSISHSGAFWVCAFSDRPVGIDLQVHGGKRRDRDAADAAHDMNRIAERFFHPAERRYLQRHTCDIPEKMEQDFYDIWAAKESYVKYTGNGIGESFRTFSVSDGYRILFRADSSSAPQAMLRFLPFDDRYSLCICAEQIGEIEWHPARICGTW